MNHQPTNAARRGTRIALAAAAGLATTAALCLAAVGPAAASTAPSSSSAASAAANPYSPTYQHPYRHGAVPTLGQLSKMNAYSAAHPQVGAVTGPETLSYGGGIDGIGVQSGHSKVYLVFYGTQWGTQSTDANGNLKFSGDPAGAAGAAQQMFKGIGTNGETWSADLTQWCDGPNVSSGATSCPTQRDLHPVPERRRAVRRLVRQRGGLAVPRPRATSWAQEAVNAAAHFGNTTAASNRYAYYVILSPHGTNPDSYQGPVLRLARLQRRQHPDGRRGLLALRRHRVQQPAVQHRLPARAAAPASSTPAAPAPSTATP